jgi:hypothetical protein
MERTQGTFLVVADDGAVVVRDVSTGQVHTLADDATAGVASESAPESDEDGEGESGDGLDLTAGEVLEATLEPEPPLEVAWRVVDVSGRRTIPVERSDERPTGQARAVAADQPVGEVTTVERAGEGELHVLTVPADRTESAAEDVRTDEATRSRAARLGVDRVEIRAADGVVSVRYLP